MKNSISHIFAALSLIALFSACSKSDYDMMETEPFHEYSTRFLVLRNYSSDDTVWFIPDKDSAASLPSELSEWQKIAIYSIPAHGKLDLTFDSTDNYVTPVETYGVNDKIVIYVFKKSVWDSNVWSALVSGKLWSGKCELSVEDARELNGFVTYPMR